MHVLRNFRVFLGPGLSLSRLLAPWCTKIIVLFVRTAAENDGVWSWPLSVVTSRIPTLLILNIPYHIAILWLRWPTRWATALRFRVVRSYVRAYCRAGEGVLRPVCRRLLVLFCFVWTLDNKMKCPGFLSLVPRQSEKWRSFVNNLLLERGGSWPSAEDMCRGDDTQFKESWLKVTSCLGLLRSKAFQALRYDTIR